MSRYNYSQPRSINWVSILLVLALAAGVYAAWKFGPVYIQASKVDTILKDEVIQAHTVKGADPAEAYDLIEKIKAETYTRLKDLGLQDHPGHPLEVGFGPGYEFLYAKYRVVVKHPFGKATTIDFTRKVDTP